MIKYSERYKSGFPVVDEVIARNWELVQEFVKRAEAWEKSSIEYYNENYKDQRRFKEKVFVPWSEAGKQLCALGCIGDLTRAMAKVITKEDSLVESSLNTYDGMLQGDIKFKRDNEEFSLNTKSITAGGYNIQRFHYRYLIKTSLPKVKVPKDVLELIEKEQSNIRRVERCKEEIIRFEKELEDNIKRVERHEAETREDNDKRIYESELESCKKGYSKAPFTVYWLDDRESEEFKTFEEYIPNRCENAWIAGRRILKRAKEDVIRYTELIKDRKETIERLKK